MDESKTVCRDIDECDSSNECEQICKNTLGSYKCSCKPGYLVDQGDKKNCSDIDECSIPELNDCDHSCQNTLGSYECSCRPGYQLDKGNKKNCSDIDECLSNPCGRKGSCNNTPGSFHCTCLDGFTGRLCSIDIDECFSSPCMNGTCSNIPRSFQCQCQKGFTGQLCETDIDECSSQPCMHGATCLDRIDNFVCACSPGYTGRFCQTVINNCASKPCQNTGFCQNLINNYTCRCPDNWKGQDCSTDVDECFLGTHKCDRRAGNCTNTIGSHKCSCIEGYEGDGFTCTEKRLFNYGIQYGDTKLNRMARDFNSPPINIPVGFPFGDTYYYRLYFSDNGLITFQRNNDYVQYIYPTPFWAFRGYLYKTPSMIAVFWDDADVRRGSGCIYYQVFDFQYKNDDHSRNFQNDLNAQINKFYGSELGITSFESKWAVRITWENMLPFTGYRNVDYQGTNTYQAVLITDGIFSFCLIQFKDGGMNWKYSTRPFQSNYALMGYYSESTSFFFNDPQTRFNVPPEKIYHPDKYPGHKTGEKGRWAYRLERNNANTRNPRQKCIDWYLKEPFPYWSFITPPCPCSFWQAFFDNSFTWGFIIKLYGFEVKEPQDTYFTFQSRFPNWQGSGVRCYYSFTGGLIYGEKERFLPTPWIHYNVWAWWWRGYLYYMQQRNNFFNYILPKLRADYEGQEVDPYNDCCRDSGDSFYCSLYRLKRPLDFCFGYIPPRIGFFFGDPHVVTLDGVKYTFNGLGEFILLNVKDENDTVTFSLQGRTLRAGENRTSEATNFVALAAEGPSGTKVQWNLINDEELILRVDGNIVNVTENSTYINQVTLQRTSNNETVASFEGGTSITVSGKKGALSFTTALDNSFKNKTEGLLGVWNDDKMDDFKAADGRHLEFDGTNLPSDSQIFFNFGLTWKTTVNDSVFTYNTTPGETWYTYNNNSFVPKFYDELLQTTDKKKIDKANETCQGNDDCIFDVLSTDDFSFGTATLQSVTSFAAQNSTMNNFPPNITGDSSIQTRLGELVFVLFSATDANDDNVTFSVLTDSSEITMTENGNFSWHPTSSTPVFAIIQANDSKATSELGLTLTLCNCSINSTCDYSRSVISMERNNTKFVVAACNCTPAYIGDYCTEDFDACQDNQCFLNDTCKDHPAPLEGYTCGPCPDNLEGDGEKCYDLDECQVNTDTCEQICINVFGSYNCSCNEGYAINAANSSLCDDIDECRNTSACPQNADCINSVGNYTCVCKSGYEGKPYSFCVDVDECIQSTICSGINSICTNTEGSFNCTCRTGYEGPNCTDIDECVQGQNNCVLNSECVNTEGSYMCKCNSGYEGPNCTDIDECTKFLDNCDNNADCQNTPRSFSCSCKSGFKGNGTFCEDIDECTEQSGNCPTTERCENSFGNYTCNCLEGYKRVNGECEDIDECLSMASCPENGQKCVNTEPFFNCECKSGFQSINGTCRDINECLDAEANNCSISQGLCVNFEGSYTCQCKAGYSGDGFTCNDVDECLDNNICSRKTNSYCVNTEGSFNCTCLDGYEGFNCSDVDECLDSNICSWKNNSYCVNTEGSFNCTCLTGYAGLNCTELPSTTNATASPSSATVNQTSSPASGVATAPPTNKSLTSTNTNGANESISTPLAIISVPTDTTAVTSILTSNSTTVSELTSNSAIASEPASTTAATSGPASTTAAALERTSSTGTSSKSTSTTAATSGPASTTAATSGPVSTTAVALELTSSTAASSKSTSTTAATSEPTSTTAASSKSTSTTAATSGLASTTAVALERTSSTAASSKSTSTTTTTSEPTSTTAASSKSTSTTAATSGLASTTAVALERTSSTAASSKSTSTTAATSEPTSTTAASSKSTSTTAATSGLASTTAVALERTSSTAASSKFTSTTAATSEPTSTTAASSKSTSTTAATSGLASTTAVALERTSSTAASSKSTSTTTTTSEPTSTTAASSKSTSTTAATSGLASTTAVALERTSSTAASSKSTSTTAATSEPTSTTAASSKSTSTTAATSGLASTTAVALERTSSTAASSKFTSTTAATSEPTSTTAASSKSTSTTATTSEPMSTTATTSEPTNNSAIALERTSSTAATSERTSSTATSSKSTSTTATTSEPTSTTATTSEPTNNSAIALERTSSTAATSERTSSTATSSKSTNTTTTTSEPTSTTTTTSELTSTAVTTSELTNNSAIALERTSSTAATSEQTSSTTTSSKSTSTTTTTLEPTNDSAIASEQTSTTTTTSEQTSTTTTTSEPTNDSAIASERTSTTTTTSERTSTTATTSERTSTTTTTSEPTSTTTTTSERTSTAVTTSKPTSTAVTTSELTNNSAVALERTSSTAATSEWTGTTATSSKSTSTTTTTSEPTSTTATTSKSTSTTATTSKSTSTTATTSEPTSTTATTSKSTSTTATTSKSTSTTATTSKPTSTTAITSKSTSTTTPTTVIPIPSDNGHVILFPYGDQASDKRLRNNLPADKPLKTNNLISPTFEPRMYFAFGKSLFSSIYFTEDGLIVFPLPNSKKYNYPNPFQNGFQSNSQPPMIAVFWINTYLSDGEVFYQEYETFGSKSSSLVQRVEKTIEKYMAIEYKATWTLKITWVNVTADLTSPADESNTYQAVITTDGTYSFVLMLYKFGGMNWDVSKLPAKNIVIGYNSGKGFFKNAEQMNLPDSERFRPDRNKGANTDLNGLWLYQLNQNNSQINYRAKCLQWYYLEPSPSQWNQGLPACPCTFSQGQLDKQFQFFKSDTSNKILRKTSENKFNAGQRCIYTKKGSFIEGWQERYWVPITQSPSSTKNQQFDLEPYNWCCEKVDDPKFCDCYEEKRPSITCKEYRPPGQGLGNGDPHLFTLDGLSYTFNGRGDFVLLNINESNDRTIFKLHGRTVQTGTANATNFEAFAAQHISSKPITVQMTLNGDDSVDVRLNNSMVQFSSPTEDNKEVYYEDTLYLEKNGNSSIVALFEDGISLTVTARFKMLTIVTSLPKIYMNKTEGLLGLWNDKQDDDFKMPNGSFIPANSTDSILFSYGLTWEVPSDQSIFTTQNVASKATDSLFTPQFLDELRQNMTLYNMFATDCNNNTQCIYDALSTGNKEIGLSTAETIRKLIEDVKILNSFPPTIEGTSMISTKLFEQVISYYTATQQTGSDVVFTPYISQDLNITENGTLIWLPTNRSGITVDVEAVGSNNQSSVIRPQLVLCDCGENGECNINETTRITGSSVYIAACRCKEGFTGRSCRSSVELCQVLTCFIGVNCSSSGCGSCPAGLTGDGIHCLDIDECKDKNPCSPNATCTNTPRSYNCTCNSGFSGNGTTCTALSDPCASSQCPPTFCCNGGTCTLNPAENCKPTCQCPNPYTGEQCTLGIPIYIAEPSPTLPKRSVNITLTLTTVGETLENSTSLAYNLKAKVIEKAMKLQQFNNSSKPLLWKRGEEEVATPVLFFDYNGNKTVIDFLNDELYSAILDAFNNAQRAVSPDNFGPLNRTDIQDITKLSYKDLLNYFSCNNTVFAGYVLQWDEQRGVVCRSPCDMDYCLNQAECQHLLTGPSCKCVPRTIYSSFGDRCEHLSMNLRAFFGILFGALAFLLLLMLAIFLIVCKYNSSGRERFTNDTNSIGNENQHIFSWQSNPFSSKMKDTSILPSLDEKNLSSLVWKPHLDNVKSTAEIKIERPSLKRNGNVSEVP
ncbi:mucin-4-like [Pristis pectinata]|uniref:mucin-4-like n=1 Tax=Pristis pectinata TaxID=685728 RepID=UPI00223DF594|nr:mucin-4-like [Pristis pectinata]